MGTSISFKRPDGKDASGYLTNAEHGNAPPVAGALDEVLERRAHRDGVRVVTVVQQQAVARQRPFFLAQLGEGKAFAGREGSQRHS